METERSMIDRAYRVGVERRAVEVREYATDAIGMYGELESPIEKIFAAWWYALRDSKHQSVQDFIELHPQYEIQSGAKTYRLDFLLTETAYCTQSDYRRYAESFGCPYPKVAVELDGHDFHERTKEQVALRDKRDRDLQVAGYKVFHISGSALWRDPEGVVDEVQSLCTTMIVDWFHAIHKAERAGRTGSSPHAW
jgi:very-short-patch-repair endonuclease